MFWRAAPVGTLRVYSTSFATAGASARPGETIL